MSLIRISDPLAEPVTLTDVKEHLRITSSSQDGYLTRLIPTARRELEKRTRRAFVDQTWELHLSAFEPRIELPLPPLIEVVSVEYIDPDGALQEVAEGDYIVIAGGEWHGSIQPASGFVWPSVACDRPDAVRIRFAAGFNYNANASPAESPAINVPPEIKQAILLMVGHYFGAREAVLVDEGVSAIVIPFGVSSLIQHYVVPAL